MLSVSQRVLSFLLRGIMYYVDKKVELDLE